jgi:hypothetical protein
MGLLLELRPAHDRSSPPASTLHRRIGRSVPHLEHGPEAAASLLSASSAGFRIAPVIRRASSLIAALWLGLSATATAAWAAPPTKVQHTGSVTGELKQGNAVTVRVAIEHPNGWQNVQRVVIALRLRGRPLDQIVFQAQDLSLSIVGDGGPVVLGQAGELHGPYFTVDTSAVALQASKDRLGLIVPVRIGSAPPPGGRLFYTYSALGAPAPGFLPLTPPVKGGGGFSWGTLAVAIAAALFVGGFVGNLFSSRRRPARPSIYATVQRRLEQERAAR